MDYDLLIRGGRIVDGSGMPGYNGDVGIRDGLIVGMGRLSGSASRAVDARGMVVAPGFIDHHTHLDAQILWDPYATCEPQHGITSVIMGNCGLTLAPVRKGGEDSLVKSFVRVEAMPRAALEQGITWGWHTFGEYLRGLEGRLGVNVGCLVGHIALRHYAMGEEAVEREATDRELAQMKQALRSSLVDGALGMSTSRNQRHIREDGKPVASRMASNAELLELAEVLGRENAGIIETVSNTPSQIEHVAWYDQLARTSGRPVVWQLITERANLPDLWWQQLRALNQTFADGYRAFGVTSSVVAVSRFTLDNAQVFDEFPTWKNLSFLPQAARFEALSNPEVRTKLRSELAEDRIVTFHRDWTRMQVLKTRRTDHRSFVGMTIASLAKARRQDPLDAFLDFALEDELETVFESAGPGGDVEVMRGILASPYVLVGISDAGAHVQFDAAFGYGTALLGTWARDKAVTSLERAVHMLTFQVASVYGLERRGLLRQGYAADIVVFDYATIGTSEPQWADDYPGGTRRLVQKSNGVRQTIVNGQIIYEEGVLSERLPGLVLKPHA